jgi:YHS domain-containing protein
LNQTEIIMRSFFLFFLVACGGGETETTSTPAPAEQAPVVEAPVEAPAASEQMLAALSKADLADGTEDKVAHKCVGCSLEMDGDAEFAIETEGYTLHMCSTECKTHFEEDVEAGLGKLLD